MQKIQIILGLLVFGILLFGCITGQQTYTVNPDGSVNMETEIQKSGMLQNADCDSLKQTIMTYMSSNLSSEDIKNLEKLPCKETESSIIINIPYSAGDNRNPISIIEKEGVQYLRFESDPPTLGLTVKVKMPSKVTSHNGLLLDEQTVFFKSNIDLFNSSKEKIFVESIRPSFPILLVAGLGIIVIIGVIIAVKFMKK